jgi:hypothetical protein
MRAALAWVVFFAALVGAAAPVPKEGPIPEVTKEHLETSERNLKEIALAFHNYLSAYQDRFPTNITDKKGKELLSWRVAILPYIEQDNLYQQFKLDEPWDSEHNKKLIEKMPKLYAPIRVRGKAGETYYQVFYGEKALFGPKQKPRLPGSIPDGTSNTALVVEAGESAIWTKPADLPFDQKKALPRLGGLFDGEFHVARGDGSVVLVKKDFDVQQMKYFIMPADGNPVDFDKLLKK